MPPHAFSPSGKAKSKLPQLTTSKTSDATFGNGGGKSGGGKSVGGKSGGGKSQTMPLRRALDEMDLPDREREAERTALAKQRSHSIGSEYGSIRFTEWMTVGSSRRKRRD